MANSHDYPCVGALSKSQQYVKQTIDHSPTMCLQSPSLPDKDEETKSLHERTLNYSYFSINSEHPILNANECGEVKFGSSDLVIRVPLPKISGTNSSSESRSSGRCVASFTCFIHRSPVDKRAADS